MRHGDGWIAHFEGGRVLVVGDAMLDSYSHGEAQRVSPEAPVLVLRETHETHVPGGAANVAVNIVALGGSATLVCRLGRDPEAEQLRRLCVERGVRVDAIDSAFPTVVKRRLMASRHQLLRLDRDTSEHDIDDGDDIVARVVSQLTSPNPPAVVVLSDYRKGVLTPETLRRIVDAATARDIKTVVDPKPGDPQRYAGCTIIKPNAAEARALWPEALGATPDVDTHEGAMSLCLNAATQTGARNAVLSLGERGVVAAGADFPGGVSAPSQVREVADVSGAGDTMVAAMALCLATDVPLVHAVPIANVAAGLACERLGTAAVSQAELARSLTFGSRARRARQKVERDWDVLAGRLASRGPRAVVLANGVFDLLHSGHVALLEEAADQGDLLIVALNSDESTTRLKGPTRPVQREDDRLLVVAALECVDHVTVFGEDTPRELILAIRPDVIVKGGDYRPEDVVGGQEAQEWGGRVHIVSLLDGRSSSHLVDRAARGGA